MSDLKQFILNEIDTNVKKEIAKNKIKESSKNLYNAVTLVSELKKKGAKPEKMSIAENLVVVAEKRLVDDYDSYDEADGGCNCENGEGEMFKAQLLSIMANAQKLYHMVDESDELEDWVQSKITIAEDYLKAVYGYMTYQNGGDDMEMDDDWDDEDYWDDVEEWEGEWDDNDEGIGETMYDPALDPNVDDEEFEEMTPIGEAIDEAEEKWIQKAISKPGQLHRDLGVPQGEKIPLEKLKAAAEKGGKIGQRARMALNLRKINK